MQQSIVKFITLSYRHCLTCFGHYNAHHQEPVKLPLQPLVSVWMWRCPQPLVSVWIWRCPPPHSYENQRLQRQFDGLLMMGIIMPGTCRAVSVRQSNKFYGWLLHLVGCFIRVKGSRTDFFHSFALTSVFLVWSSSAPAGIELRGLLHAPAVSVPQEECRALTE